MSLRTRLLITSVVLVAAGLLVANVATYRLLSNFLLHRTDDQLVAAQAPVLDALQFGGEAPDHQTPTFATVPALPWSGSSSDTKPRRTSAPCVPRTCRGRSRRRR